MGQDRGRFAGAGVVLGVLFLLLAARLGVVQAWGSATPFWDQWDAEAAFLFDPWLAGTLALPDLWSAHNEHRILSTRLLALGLLAANGAWSPLLEMTANAFLNVAALGLALVLVVRAAGPGAWPLPAAAALAAFLLPHGWENTLSGFQSQFYFVLLFGVAALWGLALAPPLAARWWLGLGLAACAFLSLASGAFAFAAAAATLALRGAALGRRADLAAALAAAACFVAAVLATPAPDYHASLKAAGLGEFLRGATVGLAWPLGGVTGALLRNAPAVLLVAWVLRQRLPADDRRWFLVALCAWALGQELSLAYARAREVLAPRYLDLHAMAFLANAGALAALLHAYVGPRRRTLVLAAAAWLVAAALAFALPAPGLVQALAGKREQAESQGRHLQAFLASGDRAALRALPPGALPYPVADRLADIVASPRVRSILPAPLRAGGEGRLDPAAHAVRQAWPAFAGLGLLLLAVSGLAGLAGRRRSGA